MSAILPPSANPAPPTSSAGPVPVSVTGDAKALAGLPAGALIEAMAQARPTKGVLEVMTADGPLQLKVLPPATLPPIPEGARLLLQTGPNGALSLMAVNGRALGGAALTGMPPGFLGGGVGRRRPRHGAATTQYADGDKSSAAQRTDRAPCYRADRCGAGDHRHCDPPGAKSRRHGQPDRDRWITEQSSRRHPIDRAHRRHPAAPAPDRSNSHG